MKTVEEKAALRQFAERFPQIELIATAPPVPLTHGYHGVMLTVRLPSGVVGRYQQDVKLG